MRPLIAALAVAIVAGLVVVGLAQTGTDNTAPKPADVSAASAREQLAGAPAPLAALHAQANQLLSADGAALKKRLAELEGYPVVLNKWASWCGPCRFEFPFFQRLGVRYGKRVAFVGLDAGDNTEEARAFLKQFPVPFPSYEDPDEQVSRSLGIGQNYPVTVFYDARGREAFVHQGGYASEDRLRQDIERYALK